MLALRVNVPAAERNEQGSKNRLKRRMKNSKIPRAEVGGVEEPLCDPAAKQQALPSCTAYFQAFPSVVFEGQALAQRS